MLNHSLILVIVCDAGHNTDNIANDGTSWDINDGTDYNAYFDAGHGTCHNTDFFSR